MCQNHSHSHNSGHEEENKFNLIRIYTSVFFLIIAIAVPVNEYIKIALFLCAYFTAGYDIIIDAFKNILNGKIFDENSLMTIATAGALCLHEYAEAVCVMLLFQIGEHLQDKAVDKTRDSIAKLMNIKPEFANIEENGALKQVKPENIKENEIIIVKSGERIPLDGIIVEGNSSIDVSSLTGESALKEVSVGDNILSGSVNINGLLKIKVTKEYKDSTVSKILELVENSSSKKSVTENFITKFAHYYTPIVAVLALFIILIPLCINGTDNINTWIERALTFLVISCPCALVISIPLSFFAGIGSASKSGILIKGSNYIEILSNAETIVFDKTGTLTNGIFKVTEIKPTDEVNEAELLEYAAYAENFSNHPVSISIKEAYKNSIDISRIKDMKEESGKGIVAEIDNNTILAGNQKLMHEYNICFKAAEEDGNIVYIAKNNKFIGYLVIADTLKFNAIEAVKNIKLLGIKPVILSGDSLSNVQKTAEKLGINDYYAELLPSGKVEKFEEIINNKNKKRNVLFIGDGINDAPVLMRSDAGIAMGALGSDAAIEAADVIITDDNIGKISTAINISKQTIRIVKQNIVFAIGVKVLFLILGAAGFMTMWGAVFADVGVTLLAILNSIRTLKYHHPHKLGLNDERNKI